MAESPEAVKPKESGGDEAAKEMEVLKAKLADAEKRAEDAEKYKGKYEMTVQERADERDKRQAEAEKNKQLEEYKAIQEEKSAEMQTKLEEQSKLIEASSPLKAKADEWDAYQEARRGALLEQLPEDKRETFKTAPLSLLEETVSLVTGVKPGAFPGASSSKQPSKSGKWSEMTDAQKVEKATALPQDQLNKLMAGG